MNKLLVRWIVIILVLVSLSMACRALSGGSAPEPSAPTIGVEETAQPPEQPTLEPESPTEPAPTEPPAAEPTEVPEQGPESYDTEFPLPDDVQNFMEISEEQINFQTSLSMDEVIEFYRHTLTAQGLQERELLTVISDQAFSMVFDGAPNGKAIVIQGVPLDDNTVNVNIRYEDV